MSAFFMVSVFADVFNDTCPLAHQHFAQHPWWDKQGGMEESAQQLVLNHSIIDELESSEALAKSLSLD